MRTVSLVTLIAVLLSVIGVGATAFAAYSAAMAMARNGLTHLKVAEADLKALASTPTNVALVEQAQGEFQRAHDDFARLQIGGALASPFAGFSSKLGVVERLLPLATEGTQAGALACDALKTLLSGLRDPLSPKSGLTASDVNRVIADVDAIQRLVTRLMAGVASLRPSDLTLDPRLGPLVAKIQQQRSKVTRLMADVDGLAHLLPQLLGVGKPATYLVLVLDSSELRPTGGFIGNFGALTVSGGRINTHDFHISDITLIDSSVKFDRSTLTPHTQRIAIPSNYNWLKPVFVDPSTASWSVRDSNLAPDYPTAARAALNLYARLQPEAQLNLAAQHSPLMLYNPATSGQFAGVISLSLGVFQQALKITGPITPPGFHQTVTADNFVSLIHTYALGAPAGPDNKACGVTSCSKVFTSAVVKGFLTQVKSDMPAYVGKLGRLLYDSLQTKDLEVYLTPPTAERALSDLGLSASVATPTSGDSLFEVDANIGANKDNYFLRYQMADHITLDTSGGATHHLAWSYQWPGNPATLREAFPAASPDYFAYSRVYAPPAATLISQSGLSGFGDGFELGRRVFWGNVGVSYDHTSKYALTWRTPDVVSPSGDAQRYTLLIQRQAGITWPLDLTISPPTCSLISGAPITHGLSSADVVTMKDGAVRVSGPLTRDASIEVDFTADCAATATTTQSSAPPAILSRPGGWRWLRVAEHLSAWLSAPVSPREQTDARGAQASVSQTTTGALDLHALRGWQVEQARAQARAVAAWYGREWDAWTRSISVRRAASHRAGSWPSASAWRW